MPDQWKKLKYFKEITDFQSLQKAEAYLEPKRAGIYDGPFLWIYLTVCYFRNESSIIDVRLGYI